MIRDGAALVQKLDETGSRASAALWFYFTDANAWRLLIASPEVATKGPRKAYVAAQQALAALPVEDRTLTLEDISMIPPDHPLLALLRMLVSTGPGIGRLRFSKNVINGQFIDDALIYRMS